MHDRRANLEEIDIPPEILMGAPPPPRTRGCCNFPPFVSADASRAAFVGYLGIASCGGELDAVPVSSVFDGDVPDVVFAVAVDTLKPAQVGVS